MRTIKTILLSKIPYWAFSLLLVMACNPKETSTQEESEPTKAPGQIITEKEAAVLFDTYSTKRVPLIQEFEDADLEEGEDKHVVARYTHFDFKVMQEYMNYIQEQADSVGKEIKSIRIYYATYPAKSKKDPNKNTVFLVPTTDFDGLDKAFKISMLDGKPVADSIPWNFDLYGQKASEEEGTKNQAGFFSISTTNATLFNGRSLILNDGGASPPPYH